MDRNISNARSEKERLAALRARKEAGGKLTPEQEAYLQAHLPKDVARKPQPRCISGRGSGGESLAFPWQQEPVGAFASVDCRPTSARAERVRQALEQSQAAGAGPQRAASDRALARTGSTASSSGRVVVPAKKLAAAAGAGKRPGRAAPKRPPEPPQHQEQPTSRPRSSETGEQEEEEEPVTVSFRCDRAARALPLAWASQVSLPCSLHQNGIDLTSYGRRQGFTAVETEEGSPTAQRALAFGLSGEIPHRVSGPDSTFLSSSPLPPSAAPSARQRLWPGRRDWGKQHEPLLPRSTGPHAGPIPINCSRGGSWSVPAAAAAPAPGRGGGGRRRRGGGVPWAVPGAGKRSPHGLVLAATSAPVRCVPGPPAGNRCGGHGIRAGAGCAGEPLGCT